MQVDISIVWPKFNYFTSSHTLEFFQWFKDFHRIFYFCPLNNNLDFRTKFSKQIQLIKDKNRIMFFILQNNAELLYSRLALNNLIQSFLAFSIPVIRQLSSYLIQSVSKRPLSQNKGNKRINSTVNTKQSRASLHDLQDAGVFFFNV